MNNKGAIFSGFMYVLLTFFLLSLASLLIVLNNTKKISNKAREGAEGIIDNSTSEISITLTGSNVMCANIGQGFTEPGYVAKDSLGNNVPVVISSDLNVYSEGEYTITYTAKLGSYEKVAQRKIHVIKNDYSYTGNYETFEFKCEGYYTVELWGAGHGNGMGGYTKGTIKFNKGEKAYLYIGQYSTVQNGTSFNGGTANSGGYPGGGATDLRLLKGTWNSLDSLKSRIMVAGGAGAGNVAFSHGGTLVGRASSSVAGSATGGTQTAPGNRQDGSYLAASFGVGGGGCGGGGGYYGAGGATCATGGAGGSSYISGYSGVNSITNDLSITHNSNTLHYSGKYFVNGSMGEGVNSGNGKAKIVYVGYEYPKTNTNFNNVRYVKACANGSSAGGDSHWVELQVLKNGLNLALGKKPIPTSPYHPGAYDYDIATDGKMDDSSKYASTQSTIYPGVQCITVDLGKIYDIDEVAVWHYYQDRRTYNQVTVSLSSDNSVWRIVLSNPGAESPNGHRENAWGDIALNAEVLIVAGGGGGGANHGGGGGAGGVLQKVVPLVQGTTYNISVGGGGAPAASPTSQSGNGGNSSAFGFTAIGGGGGGNRNDTSNASPGRDGGSGGGGGGSQTIYPTNWNGGNGTAGQGNNGGKAVDILGAGGGGAGSVGVGATSVAGSGGAGILSNISGSAVLYAGGGGGGAHTSISNVGSGGSGIGGRGSYTTAYNGTYPVANTGSGGGGGGPTAGLGCAGSAGIVIIRYPGPQIANGGNVVSSGGYTIHTFTNVGSFTFITN